MSYALEDKLVVGISTRALFDLEAAHAVFERDGVDAYTQYQIDHVDDPLPPGAGYPLVRQLLAINDRAGEPLVEVVIISRNSAETGLRARRVDQAPCGLPIYTRGVHTGAPRLWRYLDAFSL